MTEQYDIEAPIAPGVSVFLTKAVSPSDKAINTNSQASPLLRKGEFKIIVLNPNTGELELMMVTSGADGKKWSVTRGIENTKPLSFPLQASVRHIFTSPPAQPAPVENNYTVQGGLVPVSSTQRFDGLATGDETYEGCRFPGKALIIYAALADCPCRVRIYSSKDQAIADMSRDETVDPAVNAGCLLELIFIESIVGSKLIFSPAAIIVDQSFQQSSLFSGCIRCDSGSVVNLTFYGFVLLS